MLARGQEALDCMVERSDAGRQPQLQRCRQCQLGVVDHGFHHEPGITHARLVAVGVRESRSGGEICDLGACWPMTTVAVGWTRNLSTDSTKERVVTTPMRVASSLCSSTPSCAT